MDVHFILKKVEAEAVTRCLFLQQESLRWMLLSQLPEPTLILLKEESSLRPFRTILLTNTVLSLSTKFLQYESSTNYLALVKLRFTFQLLERSVFFFLAIFYNRLSRRNAAGIFASMRAETTHEKSFTLDILIKRYELLTTAIHRLKRN